MEMVFVKMKDYPSMIPLVHFPTACQAAHELVDIPKLDFHAAVCQHGKCRPV